MNLSEELRQTFIIWKELLGLKTEPMTHIELQLLDNALTKIATKLPADHTSELIK